MEQKGRAHETGDGDHNSGQSGTGCMSLGHLSSPLSWPHANPRPDTAHRVRGEEATQKRRHQGQLGRFEGDNRPKVEISRAYQLCPVAVEMKSCQSHARKRESADLI